MIALLHVDRQCGWSARCGVGNEEGPGGRERGGGRKRKTEQNKKKRKESKVETDLAAARPGGGLLVFAVLVGRVP